jgi:hypothetical protein
MTQVHFKSWVGYGGVFVLLASFGVYLLTLTPTVGLHDSGDMITSFLFAKRLMFSVYFS